MLPTLADFLAACLADCDSIQESPPGTNRTRYGNEREAHYPGMVALSDGNEFPLTWGTDWCGIAAGHSYAAAAGWPDEWPLPIQSFYCPRDVADWRAADKWHLLPSVGDFVYFSWLRNGLANHVGVVVGVKGQWLDVAEGNVGNPSVWRRRSSYMWGSGSQVLGFGRPEFAPEPTDPPTENPMPTLCVRIQPFDGITVIAPGQWLSSAMLTALLGAKPGDPSSVVISPFHAQAVASMCEHAGVTGSALRCYPGEILTDAMRAELAALGVIVPK